MQRSMLFASFVLTVVLCVPVVAQPVILVNGSPGGAVITQGQMLSWSITVPTGTISNNQLWIDVNRNARVDEGTDKLLFIFSQQDGPALASDAPEDMDGVANGTITTHMNAGIAPASWLFVAVANNGSDTADFRIDPMANPPARVTGTVSAPPGALKAYIIIEAQPHDGGKDNFWQGLTDSLGAYTINIGGSPATLNPWRVSVSQGQMLGRLLPLHRDTLVTLGAANPVVNFQLVLGTILAGIVRDGSAAPVQWSYPHVHPAATPEVGTDYGGETGPDGRFMFAVPSGTWLLHFTKDGYKDQWWNGKTSSSTADQIVVTTQDSITNLNGVIIKSGEIRGTVRNYGMPTSGTVILFTMPGEVTLSSRQTNNDGSYSFNVDPGTFYVKFQKDGTTQYWDHSTSSPGRAITITGTETISGIDGDFSVGPPPPPPGPRIMRVADVPFDNGRHVYVRFAGVEHLLMDMPVIGEVPFGVEKYSVWRRDAGTWNFVGQVPAAHDSIYSVIVPTLRDSTKTEGMWWSRYIVKAHFLFNFYVIPSQIDSGYSLDNLAPNVPGGAGSTVSGGDVVLRWTMSEDEDFRYFTVYRGSTPDFPVDGSSPLTRTTGTMFTDAGAASGTFYYKITATDFAGNESASSNPLASSGTTSAELPTSVPEMFALGQNYPNPFNPTTTIVYDVPKETFVRLEMYNALGQKVADLVSGHIPAGRHAVRFDGTGMTSGLYVVRMTAGEFSAMRKVSLVK